MKLAKAAFADIADLTRLYENIIDGTPDMEKYARWKKGMYPTEAIVRDYITRDAMYIYYDHVTAAGAMAITLKQDADYHAVEWAVAARDDDVAVVHLLGVHPRYQGRGIAVCMLKEALLIAKKQHKKAVRLDALASNLPARRIYESLGFKLRGTQRLYAANTGLTDFCFYEYIPD